MSRRRGIADSVSKSAPVADCAIIFGNAQLLTLGNGLHVADFATARGHMSHPPGSLRAHLVPLAVAESVACSLFSSTYTAMNFLICEGATLHGSKSKLLQSLCRRSAGS